MKLWKSVAAAGAGLVFLAGVGSSTSPVLPALAQSASACSPDAVSTLVDAINGYRADSAGFNRDISNWPASQSLISVSNTLRGEVELATDDNLMKSAAATARKFAAGQYNYDADDAHNQTEGGVLIGPTVRAIRDGWSPRFNTLYKAGTTPPYTGIRENLFQGPANLDPSEVLRGWKNSPGHNYALLKASAHTMGVGCAQNATNSYWVFLVESEAHIHETQENLAAYFGFDSLVRFKPGANPNQAAEEAFEFIPEGLDAIRKLGN